MKMYQFFFTLLLATLGSLRSVLSAASVDDLVFGRINGGSEYAVIDCDTAASGDLTIPATYEGKPVTQIGQSAFYNCRYLTSVTIPDTVNDIRTYAFLDCRSLVSVNIPDAVTAIKGNTFYNCESLTSITIHSGITSIGNFAFRDCQALTEITIPSSVTAIGGNAFQYCESLTSVYFEGSAPNFGSYVFLDTHEELTLYVQAAYLGDYQALNLDYSLATYVPEQADGIYYTISSSFDRQNNQFIIVSEVEDASLNTQVQFTDDIAGGTWMTLSNLAYIEATNAADDTITRTITNVYPSVNAERFYRLFSQP